MSLKGRQRGELVKFIAIVYLPLNELKGLVQCQAFGLPATFASFAAPFASPFTPFPSVVAIPVVRALAPAV